MTCLCKCESNSVVTASNDTPQTVDPRVHFTASLLRLQAFGSRGGRGRHGRGGANQRQVCRKFGHEASICYHCFKRFRPYQLSRKVKNMWYSFVVILLHRLQSNSYSTSNSNSKCSLSALTMALLSIEYLWPSISCALSFHVTSSYTSIDDASQHCTKLCTSSILHQSCTEISTTVRIPPLNSYQVQSMPSSQVYTNHMTSTQAPRALYLNSDLTPATNWYPDSGASRHVTPNGGNIQQHSNFESPGQIYIGNGQGLSVSSIGTTNFTSSLHTYSTLSLHNLLHVPTITRYLLSVNKFA